MWAAWLDVPACGSVGSVLVVHCTGCWLGQIGSRLRLRRARTTSQGRLRVSSWRWSKGLHAEAQTSESAIRLLVWTAPGLQLRGAYTASWGHFSGGLPRRHPWAWLSPGPWVARLLLDQGFEWWSQVAPRSNVRARSKVNQWTYFRGRNGLDWACVTRGSWAVRTDSSGGRGQGRVPLQGPQLALNWVGTGGYGSSWVPWGAVRVNKIVVESRVVCGQNHSWVYHLGPALLSQNDLPWSWDSSAFHSLLPVSHTSTEVLVSVDGYQIIVAEWGCNRGASWSTILLTSLTLTLLFD